MPNTDPVTDNQAAVGFIVRQAQRANASRVHVIGAISVGQRGETLAEFGEMVAAGAVAVSDDGRPVVSAQLMRTALEYARTFAIPVIDHCEEPTLSLGGSMNEGIVSARLGLKGIPSEAEEIMVIRDILLARRTGGHVHLAHMSTVGSVELIRWGKERGINVTAEVCPHHISLTEERVLGYDTNAKMNPPLREDADRDAIRQGLRDGTLDVIASARRGGYATIVSARSGETEDVTIVHLAVGWGAGQLKVGSCARSERTAKWNEALRIEESLGSAARLGRLPVRKPF